MLRNEPFAAAERGPGDTIVLLISLVFTGIALASIAVLPSWHHQFMVFGSPLGIGVSGRWLLAGLLTALTAAGIDALVRSVPGNQHVDLRYTATFWVLPSLVTLAAATAIPSQIEDLSRWFGDMVLMGTLLSMVVIAEYGTLKMDTAVYRSARLALNIATYGAAFAIYATIFDLRARTLLSATAVLLVTFPLALELLRGTADQLRTTWLYASVVALVTAELTWVLNRLGLGSLAGGALLLLAFYTMSGIAQQYLAGRLNRWVILEFATIALLGFLAVALSAPWLLR